MDNKSRSRRGNCGALVAVCASLIPAATHAQNSRLGRIEAIERQIRGLQSKLQQLKSEPGETRQQLRHRETRHNTPKASFARLARPRNKRGRTRSGLPRPKRSRLRHGRRRPLRPSRARLSLATDRIRTGGKGAV
jgi:septal ring factor EnvC (AmiA/AmiB activator)